MKTFAGLSQQERASKIMAFLRQATQGMVEPASLQITAKYGQNPFLVLISCILSLRTKDTVSLPASLRLFEHATTPQEILKLSQEQIQKLIYPVGFYKTKAVTLQVICADLIARFDSKVPTTFDELVTLKGVGPKTANLVLGEGFGIPAICVDTHVHRISNRLGLVNTSKPEDTERELKKVLPPEYWREYSWLVVMWGQNICVPLSPKCSVCVLSPLCPKRGVNRRR